MEDRVGGTRIDVGLVGTVAPHGHAVVGQQHLGQALDRHGDAAFGDLEPRVAAVDLPPACHRLGVRRHHG